MNQRVGIVGAGILGRLLAYRLSSRGWEVTLFDRDDSSGQKSCSYAAAGMLSPYCELEYSHPTISKLGLESLELWPKILGSLGDVQFERRGTLVVAHSQDRGELIRLVNIVTRNTREMVFEELKTQEEVRKKEPELAERFSHALYFPLEGQINTRELLDALTAALKKNGVRLEWNSQIVALEPFRVRTADTVFSFDHVLECRGLGAKMDLKDLRGVRGELVMVRAPEVHLTRPIRLMHPRYPLYIAPRRNWVYVIGASCIESENLRPITVRTALELLSAAVSIHSGFAEAEILECVVNARPAFPNNLPAVRFERGLLHINGLYRHGYLITPRLVEYVCHFLEEGKPNSEATPLFEEL